MNGAEHAPGYVPNAGYSQDDWDEVSDTPELTEVELAEPQPAGNGLPRAIVEGLKAKRGRGPQKAPTKHKINLRLDPAVIDHFKGSGPGWQVRMGEVLKKAAGL